MPSKTLHWPDGPGVGTGVGDGAEHVGGEGPNLIPLGAFTTKFVIAKDAPFESLGLVSLRLVLRGRYSEFGGEGTQPVHWVEMIAAPRRDKVDWIWFFSLLEGPPFT